MHRSLISLLAGALVCQASLIVGTPPDVGNGNCFPFGCAPVNADSVYQQVYASSNFSGPIAISSLGFFHTQTSLGTGTYNGGTFAISFSSTSKAVNGLDTTTFANNIGADNQPFATVTLSGLAPNGEIIFGGSVFNYDPANGNLLMNINVSGTLTDHPNSNLYLDTRSGTSGGLFSRAQNFGTGFANWGLVTEFNASDVPEPSTVFLLASGILGIAAARRKR